MTADSPAGPKLMSFAAVISTATVIGVGNAMLTPSISIRVEAAGISTAWNGLLAAMPSVAMLAFASLRAPRAVVAG
ncbi:MAG: hypothetical protein HY245_01870 [Rhizobiales bacterium]|nr:hypothetical protein [Hyphomicrobiales bacterium]MBI3672175.1 hypothetical protein [Hyphomicrobiales bacterium]